ncbi:NADH-quinone oxidoreductase subunit NuoF [Peptostreptococcaceae bacterium AGR-M142]
MDFYNFQLLVCNGEACKNNESKKITRLLKQYIKRYNLNEEVEVVQTGCLGLCDLSPAIIVYPNGILYQKVQPEDIEELVKSHFIEDKPLQRLLYQPKENDGRIKNVENTTLYKNQERIVLKNCGIIDPENIEEYIAMDGYKGLYNALQKQPLQIIEELKKSNLKGRGGGGFPTGLKWEFAYKNEADQKYFICNADEGDPGAFMDRSVLEGDPHSILEAMTIGGYAIGANKGYVYIRAEYPLAIKRLNIAIDESKKYGLLGKNIFESGFDFDIEVRLGAGAFVCGEETALIKSIESKRGMPVTKPPFPASKGLFDKPTIINNVETLANVPQIILKGHEWFTKIGTKDSPGTKVFALGGKIKNTGLIEIPMGTKLRDVIYKIGGGIPNGKEFKAVQTGGPSGGCIPKEYIDIKIDYKNLIDLGSMMGSGGMIVMDEDTCMVDVARFFLDFTRDESCGKCSFCRIGTKRLLEILEKITQGRATLNDLKVLEELSKQVKEGSLCGLGKTAPNPILSTLNYFMNEYKSHVEDKKCPAKSCSKLVVYKIIEDKCQKCGMCTRNCNFDAIKGHIGELHTIDPDLCTRCGMCIEVCPFDAIIKD